MLCTTAANQFVSVQEAAMRARAKQANLETKKANEILLSFKKLDAQRELEADAAIEGGLRCTAVYALLFSAEFELEHFVPMPIC